MNFSFMGGRGPKSLRFLRLLYHLPNFIKLAWRLFWDSRIPVYRKAVLVLFEILAVLFAILYFINPLDFDFLPVIGKADDLIIGLLAISIRARGCSLNCRRNTSCANTWNAFPVVSNVDTLNQTRPPSRFPKRQTQLSFDGPNRPSWQNRL